MGQILSSKVTSDGKVIFTISTDPKEALQLQGHIDNIHIFSEKNAAINTHISLRGKNEATKYFLIPRELRNTLNFNNKVKCQRIDSKDKTIFIYVVDKYQF